jgi:hypothetical protein
MANDLRLVEDNAVIQIHKVKLSDNMQQRSEAGLAKATVNLKWYTLSFMKNGKLQINYRVHSRGRIPSI